MKFLAALCSALCLFVVACHGVPVERETLLSIEKAQPVVVVAAEEQPQELRRVARGFGGGFGGYPGYGGFGGYGGYPGYGGYGGFPGYGGYGGGYPIGGFGGFGSSSSAVASSSSGGGYQAFG